MLREHLIDVACCAVMARCLDSPDTVHRCGAVVRAQRKPLDEHQLPEPWSGRLDSAPILFVGSNPSFNPNERFPTYGWSDDEIVSFFVDRFDHTDQRPHFWRMVASVASKLLGREASAGVDYALTEIVRCKSKGEEGVDSAVGECTARFLPRTLEFAYAPIIVALGKKARATLAAEVGCPADIGVHGPARLRGKQRILLKLGHPSAGERKLPTAEEIEIARFLL